MSNQYIDELTNSSIEKFTRYLSLPTRFNIANPPDEWLRAQEAGLRKLPSVLKRPENDSLTNLFQRGLMKISEKQSLPLVPDSAVLCRSHRGLNPWRIRSLFVLVASEVTDKLERMRRPVRKNSDLAQDPEFREFVWRMTSVQGLWMERAEYRRLYENAPLRKEMVVSQCEACICAVVGGDPRLLVDFKAHLHSRARKFQPVLLRVVEAWIDAFGDRAAALHADSAVLGEKLRRVRADIGKRRHDRRQRHREAGKAVPYSEAKHDDVSKVAAAASDAYRGRAPGSGHGGSSSRSAPPADYVSDDNVDEYDYGDEFDERHPRSRELMEERRRNFYPMRDISSSHSAFHIPASRPTAQLPESSMPTRDVSRDRDTSVRGYQSEWEGVGATRPTRQSSQSRTRRPPRAASSAYSTSSSMAQRQADDLSEFERLAISTGNNDTGRGRPSRASSHHRTSSMANYPPSASRSGSLANGRHSSISSHTRVSGNYPPSGSTNRRHTTNPARISPESETVSHPPPRPVNNRPVTQDSAPEGRHDSLYPAPLNIRKKDRESPADAGSSADRESRRMAQSPPSTRPSVSRRRTGSRPPTSYRHPSAAPSWTSAVPSSIAPSTVAPSTRAPSTIAPPSLNRRMSGRRPSVEAGRDDVWSSVRRGMRDDASEY